MLISVPEVLKKAAKAHKKKKWDVISGDYTDTRVATNKEDFRELAEDLYDQTYELIETANAEYTGNEISIQTSLVYLEKIIREIAGNYFEVEIKKLCFCFDTNLNQEGGGLTFVLIFDFSFAYPDILLGIEVVD